MQTYEGTLQYKNGRIGIVTSRFNELVTRGLHAGAYQTLLRHGVDPKDILSAWVPGAFEIPLIAKKLAQSGRVDVVICLGCVIRGQTAHFDYVAGQCASGIASVALETGIPIIFEVLATDNLDHALERAGSKAGNKGSEAAVCAIEMVDLIQQLEGAPRTWLSQKFTVEQETN